MGIGMAMGARPFDIGWLVVKEVMMLVLIGALAGIPAAIALGRLIAGSLGILAAVALLAAYVPARRAAAVDPTVALKI